MNKPYLKGKKVISPNGHTVCYDLIHSCRCRDAVKHGRWVIDDSYWQG